ncbi:flagellar protein FlgN [Pseudomonas sp. NW5]|uniref:flagella synthesis protein FlgN n=1 Tax=Pseudomonas sp. NW5 TaxID=2934934 RepID=UPI0020220261|nr:flagellar protein FlgN [Pseudomonas sp. NW5]MCL7462231.1 flagellar protein FlgN [Pseudomonas sp. NW5]
MSLANHLARQQQTLQTFIALLEDEQRLLGAPEVDGQALLEIVERKQGLLEHIGQQEALRSGAQLKLGYPQGHAGAEQAARDADCLPAWHALRELAERAQTLNQINGEIIHLRMAQNQRILNFLNEAAGQGLYDPSGQARRAGLSGLSSKA